MTQYARLILPELAPSTRPEKLLFDDAELIPEYPVRVVPNGSNVVVVLSPPRKNPAENTSPAAAIADPITVEEVDRRALIRAIRNELIYKSRITPLVIIRRTRHSYRWLYESSLAGVVCSFF
jgi:hypothetical protein